MSTPFRNGGREGKQGGRKILEANSINLRAEFGAFIVTKAHTPKTYLN